MGAPRVQASLFEPRKGSMPTGMVIQTSELDCKARDLFISVPLKSSSNTWQLGAAFSDSVSTCDAVPCSLSATP